MHTYASDFSLFNLLEEKKKNEKKLYYNNSYLNIKYVFQCT
jgi:hypothetical protein